jgi:hypothetical protein
VSRKKVLVIQLSPGREFAVFVRQRQRRPGEEPVERFALADRPANAPFEEFGHEFGHALAFPRRRHAQARQRLVRKCHRQILHLIPTSRQSNIVFPCFVSIIRAVVGRTNVRGGLMSFGARWTLTIPPETTP